MRNIVEDSISRISFIAIICFLVIACDNLIITETGSEYTSDIIGTLKYVPTGSFMKGDTLYNITQPFRMSQYEITRAQFQAIMGIDPSNTTNSCGPTDPVQMVNLYHAIAFCNKLSLKEGFVPVYTIGGITDWAGLTYDSIPTSSTPTNWNTAEATLTNNGYRLPTRSEWIWAAMGATSDRSNSYTGVGVNTTGYTKGYAGSTERDGSIANIDYYAWYKANSSDTTHPVGTAGITGHPNELGLYDMSGNVGEWCWDYYSLAYYYPLYLNLKNLKDDRSMAHSERFMYGGSWAYDAIYCNVCSYYQDSPYLQKADIGFRVVRP